MIFKLLAMKTLFTPQKMASLPAYLLQIDDRSPKSIFYALEYMRLYNEYITKETISRKKFRTIQEKQAQKLTPYVQNLMRELHIPDQKRYDPAEVIETVQQYWNLKYPGDYKIFIFSKYNTNKKPIHKSSATEYHYPIMLFLNDNYHYDGIKSIGPSMRAKYYCLSCESTYTHREEHTVTCKANCTKCRRPGPEFPCKPVNGYFSKCNNCNMEFINPDCYDEHMKREICLRFQKCGDCGVEYNLKVNTREGREGHICHNSYCRICHQWHLKTEKCTIKKLTLRPKRPYRIVAYDFECTQDKEWGRTKKDDKISQHVPNFISAYITCSRCVDERIWQQQTDCDICGNVRTLSWAPFDFNFPDVQQKNTTEDPLKSFTEWFISLNPRYKTYAYAHYGGRYDMHFLLGEFLKLRQDDYIPLPEVIKNGNKIMQMKLRKTKDNPETIFRDSYNIMPVKLAALIKAFGLNIIDKQYFPHLFNKAANYNNPLPHLPPIKDYFPETMKTADRQKFMDWYNRNYNTPFDLKEKLPEYCLNDVNILIHALIEMRQKFIKISARPNKTPIDIIADCMTIASAAIKLWSMNYMGDNQVAIVPERGYDSEDTQSVTALKYLAWFGFKNKCKVQTSESSRGEYRLKRPNGRSYQIDGYIRRPGHPRGDLALEVHGCVYHACPTCYPFKDTPLLKNRKTGADITAGELRAKDEERQKYISEHMELKVVWTCEIEAELKINKQMARFFKGYRVPGPLKIRDSFTGGRTGPFKLYAKVKPGYRISYKDFTSLYPWTNFKTEYPLGHPDVIKIAPDDRKVNWTQSAQNPYKGILQVLLLPPQNMKVPLMPLKVESTKVYSRLLFPLCRACAMKYPEGERMTNYRCNHSPLRRAFYSTCTHLELNTALDHGYRALELYKVLNYKEWTTDIFQGYVSQMMQMKIEASGWPDWCEDDATQDQFIKENLQMFGIEIEKGNVELNSGLRFIAKLLLNSLWGRFSLRNNLTKTVFCDTREETEFHLYNDKINIEGTPKVMPDRNGDDIFLINFKDKEQFIEENPFSNVVLSLFTTSAARIELFKALNKVTNTPGCELLYCDTDSIIYIHPVNNDPLPTGKGHLGELTDETPNHFIVEYISAGCKNYALKLERKDGTGFEYICKIRGFQLTDDNERLLNFDIMKEYVFAYRTPNQLPPLPIPHPFSLRPYIEYGYVLTKPQYKNYNVVVSKGIIDDNDLTVIPFGYRNF